MSWVKLHRKFLKWEWYDDVNTKSLFLHLLLSANYEEKNWRGITIKRGQIVVGSLTLAEQIGLSRQSLRTSLAKLKSTNEITTEATNQYTIITIVKYEEYQAADEEVTSKITNEQPTTNQRATNEQPTNNQRLTTTKEIQEIKERKKEEYIGDFSDFWNRCGKVGSVQRAEKAFNKIKGVDYETVIAGLERYQNYCRANASWYHPKHASTWLADAGWKDEYPVTQSPTAPIQGASSQYQRTIEAAMRGHEATERRYSGEENA